MIVNLLEIITEAEKLSAENKYFDNRLSIVPAQKFTDYPPHHYIIDNYLRYDGKLYTTDLKLELKLNFSDLSLNYKKFINKCTHLQQFLNSFKNIPIIKIDIPKISTLKAFLQKNYINNKINFNEPKINFTKKHIRDHFIFLWLMNLFYYDEEVLEIISFDMFYGHNFENSNFLNEFLKADRMLLYSLIKNIEYFGDYCSKNIFRICCNYDYLLLHNLDLLYFYFSHLDGFFLSNNEI